MSDEGGSWLDSAEEAVMGASHTLLEGVEAVGEWGAGEVVGVGETVYHAGAGIYDAATGDWDGAANQMGSMADSALNVASGGLLGMAEAGYDSTITGARAAGASDEEAPTHSDLMHHGLKEAGEWLGDKAYELIHGDEDG